MISFFASRAGAILLVVLSVIYGGVIAVLGAAESAALAPFTIGGALALGILWVVRSMLASRATPRAGRE